MLHIIYTETKVLASKMQRDWRYFQDTYPDYKASYGPIPEEEAIEMLDFEHLDIFPSALVQITDFMQSTAKTVELTFTTPESKA